MKCLEEFQVQSWTFFILTFAFKIVEISYPFIRILFTKKAVKVARNYIWGPVDQIIEEEYSRASIRITADVDHILFDYAEVTL